MNLQRFLLISLIAMGVSQVFAQVDTAWVRRYNGPGNGDDYPNALAADDSGNVYVTGFGLGAGLTNDYLTIKYKPNGDTAWVRFYNGSGNSGDTAWAIAVDDSGNVYVTGSGYTTTANGSGSDYSTIKYAPNGDIVWQRYYNSSPTANRNDYAYAQAVDDSGNVYVSGASAGLGTNLDYATIKYAGDGTARWSKRYNGPGSDFDAVYALAVDDSGNVYVTGQSVGSGTGDDYATIKYAPNGDTVWLRRYNGPGNSTDIAYALAVDDNGNVLVTGHSFGSGTSDDYATIKYAPNGDTLWVRRYNGVSNGQDWAFDLAIDSAGNVCVTGFSWDGTSKQDYATIKYDPDGSTLWERRYNGPGNYYDFAFALAVDGSGNVYVTGIGAANVSNTDYTTIKYSPEGDSLWTRSYKGPGDNSDEAYAVAIDNAGNVYVTGNSYGSGTGFDYATIKYTQCFAKPGDANASGTYTLGDAIAIVNYIFNKPGCVPLPTCWLSGLLCRGDWNGTGTVTLGDAIRAVNYVFNKPGGPWDALPIGVCCLAGP